MSVGDCTHQNGQKHDQIPLINPGKAMVSYKNGLCPSGHDPGFGPRTSLAIRVGPNQSPYPVD